MGTEVWKAIKNNAYKYIAVAVISGMVSVFTFVGAFAGIFVSVPARVDALELSQTDLKIIQETQFYINERQLLINDLMQQRLESIDKKLDILISK